MSLTKKERNELRSKAVRIDMSSDFREDYDDLLQWVSQKKKEWQELAVAEYRLQELENRIASSNRP